MLTWPAANIDKQVRPPQPKQPPYSSGHNPDDVLVKRRARLIGKNGNQLQKSYHKQLHLEHLQRGNPPSRHQKGHAVVTKSRSMDPSKLGRFIRNESRHPTQGQSRCPEKRALLCCDPNRSPASRVVLKIENMIQTESSPRGWYLR